MTTTNSPSTLSDRQLLQETARAANRERHTTAEFLALLAEVDWRKLYLGEGFSSMFAYCTQVLHLSEPETYSRITAARLVRRFPILLRRLEAGAVNLTTITLLSGHLTDENHEALVAAAEHKSKRDVEQLVAALHPQPDIASTIRKLPVVPVDLPLGLSGDVEASPAPMSALRRAATPPKSLIAPLSIDRYLMRITIGDDTRIKLDRARDLLRHTIPNGDPAAIVDRALTVLVEQLEKQKAAATFRPKAGAATTSDSRHVPAAVKRAVWQRDAGRCAFVGTVDRCRETGFLEFHHVVPYSAGGPTTVENLQLRCRAHNAYEARELWPDRVSGQAPGGTPKADSARAT